MTSGPNPQSMGDSPNHAVNIGQIKPCPFCGASPVYDHTRADGVRFWCWECDEATFEDFEQAAGFWNRRTSPAENGADVRPSEASGVRLSATDEQIPSNSLVERLRALDILENNPLGREAAQHITALEAENERLRERICAYRARLEIDRFYRANLETGEMEEVRVEHDDTPDGIECRDETIRLLRDHIQRLRQERDEAVKWKDDFASDYRTMTLAETELREAAEARATQAETERDEAEATADRLASGWTNSAAEAFKVRQKIGGEAARWKERAQAAELQLSRLKAEVVEEVRQALQFIPADAMGWAAEVRSILRALLAKLRSTLPKEPSHEA